MEKLNKESNLNKETVNQVKKHLDQKIGKILKKFEDKL